MQNMKQRKNVQIRYVSNRRRQLNKIIEMTLDSDDFETIVHVQREQLMFKKQPIFLNRGFEKQKKTCFYVFFLFYVFFIR